MTLMPGDEPLDRDGPVPLYVQLADYLRAQIASGELPAARAIPSKRTALERWGVAGHTFDRAIAILKAENLVQPVRGKGIFVLPRPAGDT